MDREQTLEHIARRLAAEGRRVVAAYVFGSTARDDAGAASDVDVAVVLAGRGPSSPEDVPVEIQADLEVALGRPVDLVILNRAPPDLIHRVLRDGALVHVGDEVGRIRFEVDARNAYFDLQPILTRYRRQAIRSA